MSHDGFIAKSNIGDNETIENVKSGRTYWVVLGLHYTRSVGQETTGKS
jgi:hypothetical protein